MAESMAESIAETLLIPGGGEIGSCQGRWDSPNHLLFQLAHAAILVSYLAPSTVYGVVFLHGTLILGFLLLSGWAWAVICAPDIFSWNFSFMLINTIQTLFILYRVRPVKFSPELEEVYSALFQPLKVPRHVFKKLVAPECCSVLSLGQGEYYAKQENTRTDRLGLLIHGSARVLCHGQLLHHVQEKQFLDSPEFESTAHSDERFHVSIVAEMPCKYVFWQRQSLEYLFVKETYLATVMGTIIGRDITNKLYTLNEKIRISRGARVDIRLPSVSTAIIGSKSDMRNSSGRSPDVTNMAGGDSAFDLVEEGEEGAYCSLLQHDMTRHHHYDTSIYQYDRPEDQVVNCAIL